jgi:hypothetical protein
MSVIYSDAWYEDMKKLINLSEELRQQTPKERIVISFEVEGDGASPYVPADGALYFMIVFDEGQVREFQPLGERFSGKGLDFRFTAPATVWESIAAGKTDPITAGLRGSIKIRGDMKFLMENADGVKLLVDLYGNQVDTEWPKGQPPYS